HPEHGGYVYFTSARPAHYRVYSQVNSAMWCCVGTGMENHGKYGEMIYTHDEDALYINLFVASELDWEEKGLKLKQHTDFPVSGKSTLTIDNAKSSVARSEEHTSELQSRENLVCRLLLEKKKRK